MKRKSARKLAAVVMVVGSSLLLTGCNPLFLKPSNMVSLGQCADPGQTISLNSGNPDGTSGGLFTVPAARVLVITRAIIHPFDPGPGTLNITFIQSEGGLPDRIRQTWLVPNSEPTEFDFSPGYVISSESRLKIRNNATSAGKVCIQIYGYISPDQ